MPIGSESWLSKFMLLNLGFLWVSIFITVASAQKWMACPDKEKSEPAVPASVEDTRDNVPLLPAVESHVARLFPRYDLNGRLMLSVAD